MAHNKDKTSRFIEETSKYTKSVAELKKMAKLDPEVVQGLLQLVKGIDDLLIQQQNKNNNGVAKETRKEVVLDRKPTPKTIEFDIGKHLPKNYYTPTLALNEKNCPGLLEKRPDFKPFVAVQKKNKGPKN